MTRQARKNRVVAVVVPAWEGGRDMLSGVLEAMRGESRFQLTVVQDPAELTASEIRRHRAEANAGFIISMPPDKDALDALARSRLPTVYVNVRDTGASRNPSNVRHVWNDNASIGRLAAQHLAGLGFVNFAFAGACGNDWSAGRALGFRAALPKGATHDEKDFPSPELDKEAQALLKRWLADLPKPVAILAAHDYLAHDIATAARAVGLAVPEQVAVMGVDDDRHTVSTVTPDYRGMGFSATKALLTLMHGRRCPVEPINVEAKRIIIRDTTKLRRTDVQLAQSVSDYLRQHHQEDIDIADIAEALGVSRSTLQHRFREHAGLSVREALEEERLKTVRRLLKAGKSTLAEIAAQSGFASANRLSHVFSQRYGTSPAAWGKEARRTGKIKVEARG